MSGRRISLPGADELFRSTSPLVPGGVGVEPAPAAEAAPAAPEASAPPAPVLTAVEAPTPVATRAGKKATGRERHEEKITVYCSAEELLDLERARLTMRGEHGVAVDRGRIVRAAVSLALAELEAKGRHSKAVEHLRAT